MIQLSLHPMIHPFAYALCHESTAELFRIFSPDYEGHRRMSDCDQVGPQPKPKSWNILGPSSSTRNHWVRRFE